MHTQAIGIPGKHIQLRALSQEDLPLLLSWENDPEGWYSSGTINPPLSRLHPALHHRLGYAYPRDGLDEPHHRGTQDWLCTGASRPL